MNPEQEQIEVTVGWDGALQVDPLNFQGKDCDAATAPLYEVLGDITDRENKPEYNEAAKPNNRGGSRSFGQVRQ